MVDLASGSGPGGSARSADQSIGLRCLSVAQHSKVARGASSGFSCSASWHIRATSSRGISARDAPPLAADGCASVRHGIRGESVRQCGDRVVACWTERVAPLVRQGANVLVVAHANSMRALIATIDDISAENMRMINVPNRRAFALARSPLSARVPRISPLAKRTAFPLRSRRARARAPARKPAACRSCTGCA